MCVWSGMEKKRKEKSGRAIEKKSIREENEEQGGDK